MIFGSVPAHLRFGSCGSFSFTGSMTPRFVPVRVNSCRFLQCFYLMHTRLPLLIFSSDIESSKPSLRSKAVPQLGIHAKSFCSWAFTAFGASVQRSSTSCPLWNRSMGPLQLQILALCAIQVWSLRPWAKEHWKCRNRRHMEPSQIIIYNTYIYIYTYVINYICTYIITYYIIYNHIIDNIYIYMVHRHLYIELI